MAVTLPFWMLKLLRRRSLSSRSFRACLETVSLTSSSRRNFLAVEMRRRFSMITVIGVLILSFFFLFMTARIFCEISFRIPFFPAHIQRDCRDGRKIVDDARLRVNWRRVRKIVAIEASDMPKRTFLLAVVSHFRTL